MSNMGFRDRREAGQKLGEALLRYRDERPLVLALPRGGVPVAREVADALGAPLDVLVVRRLVLPANPEQGYGAVAEDDTVYLDHRTLDLVDVSQNELGRQMREAKEEVFRRARLYRDGRSRLPVEGRTVVLVDDGIATGGTIRAALEALKRAGVGKVVLAAPVIASAVATALRPLVAELVCLEDRPSLGTISRAYGDFRLLRDSEVVSLLGAGGTATVPVVRA
ncbi:MAG: phosphoribosyltransferase [Myxococcota bacterium]|nr:phosphoribosyltransferase [Myxococcota bacterium]